MNGTQIIAVLNSDPDKEVVVMDESGTAYDITDVSADPDLNRYVIQVEEHVDEDEDEE